MLNDSPSSSAWAKGISARPPEEPPKRHQQISITSSDRNRETVSGTSSWEVICSYVSHDDKGGHGDG